MKKQYKMKHIQVKVTEKMFKDINAICKTEHATKQKLMYSILYQFLYRDD